MILIRRLSAIVLCALLFAPAAMAQEAESPNKEELREKLAPIYQELKNDPQFQALQRGLEGNHRNREVVDRYLAYATISPLEMLELEMHERKFEVVVPRFIREWHDRWIVLREPLARKYYGDAYVEAKLARGGVDPAPVDGPQAKVASVGTNRNAAATFAIAPEDYQGEIQVAVNPQNPNQIVAGANTFDDAGGACPGDTQAIFYSSDGGVTWGYTCAPGTNAYPALSCGVFQFGSDPAIVWNDQGEVFLEYMLLCTADGSNIRFSIVVAKSTDGGATWNGQGVVANSYPTINQIEDKEFLAIDNNPSSPFYGRMYTCWDRNNNEKSAYSTDGGATWTEVDLPPTPGSGAQRLDLGCEMEVEDDGTVHVVYDTLTCLFNCTNEQMYHSRSTNGGVSWSTPVLVRDFNLVGFSTNNCPAAQNARCIGPFGSVGVDNSGGPCDGYLYATFTDFTSGNANNADVWVSRSRNDGATWSQPVKVNDDGLANKTQFHSFLVVDQVTGHPVVAWHDARNDPGNKAIDYYVSRSLDCGGHWETNIQASQPSSEFNNSGISFSNENTGDNPGANPNQYGEYLGLDAGNGKAYLAWSDTRHYFPGSTSESQKENLGFTVVDFGYTLTLPKPGVAGVSNEWVTVNSTPGQLTYFIYGFTPGSTAIPGCPGVSVGMADINILATDTADANGNASTNFTVPGGASGLAVIFQAVELATCEVSNVYTYTFQ